MAKVIKGIPASRGVAEGKVVIINSVEDIKKFKEGIIVAPYTSPIYVPIMNMAKAIVTDQGGILSHAAIISRELKIPCVVGTKNATKILRDGNKGIINILKDANKNNRYRTHKKV
jgi:pyruvate,water dikinase